MKLKKHKKIIVLLVAMFIFYTIIDGAFSIYRETKTDTISLNILNLGGTVTVTFSANGGSIDPQDEIRDVQSGTAVGQLPVATRNNYSFIGWFTDPSNGVEITSQTIVTGSTVTYYAHWTKIVCKKAITGTLHTETCVADSACIDYGYSANDTITYGTIPSANSPVVGDAYDCDVNNDDVWDSATERFYFVRSYGTGNSIENSVLVHYTSFDELGQMNSSSLRNSYHYSEAQGYLPTSSDWDNPSLITMNGNVTRFPSRKDIKAACGSTSGNDFQTCKFYLENSKFQSESLGKEGIWLEEDNNTYYRILTNNRTIEVVQPTTSENTARPTIQIPSNTIEGFVAVQKYKVHLYSEGGTQNEYEFEKYSGQNIGYLPEPTKEGYTFDGWYLDNFNYTNQITENTTVTGNINAYAKWTQVVDPLDYVFYIPGQCSFTSSGLTNGPNGNCISTINPTNSEINYTQSPYTEKKYIDTGIALYDTNNIGKDFELGFTIVYYSSAYNEYRATIVNSKSEHNTSSLKYPGFTFRKDENTTNFLLQSRKTLSSNAEYKPASASVQDVKIYRTGDAIYYSINGGEKTKLNDLEYNPEFDLTTWFGAGPTDTTATSAQRFLNGILGNMYIKLEVEKVNVTFDPNFQGASTFNQTVSKNRAIGELPNRNRSGYALLGWFTEPTGGTQITENTIINSNNITYYAHWVENITVTLNTNGGSVEPNTRTFAPGTAIGELPIPTRTGHTFLGWFSDNTAQATEITSATIFQTSTSIYAKWLENITITFNANGGSVEPNTRTFAPGLAIGELPIPTRTGYTFLGWFSDDTAQAAEITSSTTFQATTSIYAKWVENITITFNANGGSVDPSTKSFIPGNAIGELPTPTRPGFRFLGWFSDNTEQAVEITAATRFSISTSIYAKWEAIIYYTITYNTDGGTIQNNSKNVLPNSVAGELDIPEKANYLFVGWFTDDTNYTTEVTADTIITNDIDVYAKWVDETYVACIGSTCYTTLDTAISNVPTTGVKTIVKLIKDITISTMIEIDSTKNIEFDLQNFTITSSTTLFKNSGTIHIKNGNIICTSTTTADRGIINLSGAIVNITGGYIQAATTIFENKGTINVSNGEIKCTTNETTYSRAIINSSGGIVNISGGLLQATKTNVMENKGTANISGGRLEANGQSGVINNETGGVLDISAGQLIGTSTTKCQAVYNNGGTVTIRGTAYLENNSQPETGSSQGRAAVHNNAGTVNIISGTIISKQHSAIKNNATMTIGTDDDSIDITNPVIQGYNFGLETVTGKTVYVYDGIFKGRGLVDKAISDESVVSHGTTTITHTNETIDEDIYDVAYLVDPTATYTVTFNTNSGTMTDANTRTFNQVSAIGSLPSASKTNTEFLGWFTSATGGEKILPTRIIDDDITIYAHYTNTTIVCRPATTLHTSGNTSFGQIPSKPILSAGDAFDCDVDGDGTYDPTTERFYYLKDSDNGNAVLIFYDNISQVSSNATPICNATASAYGTGGPTTAIEELPTTGQWSNVSLYSEPRTITNELGTTVTNNYIYTGKATRFATLDEIKSATNNNINGTVNELASYAFLLENTELYGNTCRSNYWLETTNSTAGAYMIDGGTTNGTKLGISSSNSAVRPVIEVPYSSIEDANGIVEFDTIPAAMRTYFNNVNSWNTGQDDTSYSSFNNAMLANLNNYNCVYYQEDNTDTQYGTNYCDQPNKYDTGITGNINVYEYNESTGVISNTIANYVSNDNGKLYNFVPGKVYYWESATDSTKNGFVRPTGERRLITINGTNRMTRNVRDLGGLPVDTDGNGTLDGTVKYQKIYRGEKIWGSNHSGTTRGQFEKLGIYNEFDLRTQGVQEVIYSVEDQLINYTPFEIVSYKIDHTEFGNNSTEPQFNGKSYYQLTRDSAIDIMQKVVAGNDNYSIYLHSYTGADRTGTLAYILEGLLGVPTEYRYQDYELTTFYGLRDRTRYYNNNYKFIYLKKAIRHATQNNNELTGPENVMDWFLLEGNSTNNCNDISALITQFRTKMIDYN